MDIQTQLAVDQYMTQLKNRFTDDEWLEGVAQDITKTISGMAFGYVVNRQLAKVTRRRMAWYATMCDNAVKPRRLIVGGVMTFAMHRVVRAVNA